MKNARTLDENTQNNTQIRIFQFIKLVALLNFCYRSELSGDQTFSLTSPVQGGLPLKCLHSDMLLNQAVEEDGE